MIHELKHLLWSLFLGTFGLSRLWGPERAESPSVSCMAAMGRMRARGHRRGVNFLWLHFHQVMDDGDPFSETPYKVGTHGCGGSGTWGISTNRSSASS